MLVLHVFQCIQTIAKAPNFHHVCKYFPPFPSDLGIIFDQRAHLLGQGGAGGKFAFINLKEGEDAVTKEIALTVWIVRFKNNWSFFSSFF